MAAAAKINVMENQIITANDVWQLLQPSETFDTRGRYERCLCVWSKLDAAKQSRVYHLITEKKQKGDFINPNPCFALDDAIQEDETQQARQAIKKRKQSLTFSEYYARFGTTAEQDGWKMENPTGNQVIYVKAG